MAETITLTTGSDTIAPSSTDLTVYGTASTINSGDNINAGAGSDSLILAGSGEFDLRTPANFTGFEHITLVNETSNSAVLRLRDGQTPVVQLGRGSAVNAAASNGDPLITVYLSRSADNITGGDEDDRFVADSYSLTSGDVINGGKGYNTLAITATGLPHAGTVPVDLQGSSIIGFSQLSLGSGGFGGGAFTMTSAQIEGFAKFVSSGLYGTVVYTPDPSLDISKITFMYQDNSNIEYGGFAINGTSKLGTTFHVTNFDQAKLVRGNVGSKILSDSVLTFAQRESLLSSSIRTVSDPSGTYQKLIQLGALPALTNSSTVTVAGTADASAVGPVSLYQGASLLGTANIRADGTWTANVNLAQDGRYDVTAKVSDKAGNTGSSSGSVTVDTTPPTIAITTRGGDAFSRTIPLSGSAISQSAAGSNTGAEVGRTVAIFDGATQVGTATIGSGGQWTAIATLVSDGIHTLVARETDAAGNLGSSNTVAFNVHGDPARFGAFARDASSPGGAVYALYDGLLGRAPDPLALEATASSVARGTSLGQIAAELLDSPEGQARLGASDNAAFVGQLYQSALRRAPDAGAQGWIDTLDRGGARADVAVGLALSPEHLGSLSATYAVGVFVPDQDASNVARLYYGVLDRSPDAAGLSAWTTQVRTGAPLATVAAAFLASAEYEDVSTGLTDRQYAAGLYQLVLGRDGGTGVDSWATVLGNGTASRTQAAYGFVDSAEFQGSYAGQSNEAYVAGLYQHVLGRSGDEAGQQGWAQALVNGASRTSVAEAFVNSGEFQRRYVTPSDRAFVEGLYENALGRPADAGGAQAWTAQLESGTSRADLAATFVESAEARQHLASSIEAGWYLA